MLRFRKRVDCYVLRCCFCSSSCIHLHAHHLCQVVRGARTCAQPSDHYQWFWWLNQPPRDNCRQW
jgi:hypothetical protein